ncbi:hypothetical protein [Streptomyces achromogenes]|uniref:hypothetical protein n=1 Tax=Streptomyces achromogenes TaxID=67255 RepID=UPI0036B1A06C
MPRPTRAQRAAELAKAQAFVDATPANPPWRRELDASPDWKQRLNAALQQITNSTDDDEAMAIVLPHVEAAFKRGYEAGASRAGYRLVRENEQLRRELDALRREIKENPCTATAAGRTPASNTATADEPPEAAAP